MTIVNKNTENNQASTDTKEAVGDVIQDTATDSYAERMKNVLKDNKVPKALHSVKLGTLTAAIDFSKNLKEERDKHGNSGGKDYVIAGAQVAVDTTISIAGGVAGTPVGPVGTVAGAVTASTAYNYLEVSGDKTTNDLVGDVVRSLVGKPDGSKVGDKDASSSTGMESGLNSNQIPSTTSSLFPNQESSIEKQYNLPPGSVKSSGMEYKASEIGDHIEFQYQINNPNINAKPGNADSSQSNEGKQDGGTNTGSSQSNQGTQDGSANTGASQSSQSSYSSNSGASNFGFTFPSFTDHTSSSPFGFGIPSVSDRINSNTFSFYKAPEYRLGLPFQLSKPDTVKTAIEGIYSRFLAQQELTKCYAYGGCGPVRESQLRSVIKNYQTPSWVWSIKSQLGYAASHVSPLVLDLEGDGIELFPYTNGVYFDIDNDRFKEKVGWPSASEGQLARDINKNGIIDDITELFGDDLISAFLKLSLLDSNKDGVIDENDEKFNELLIWQDKNKDGYSGEGELKSLKKVGIKSISLNTTIVDRVIEGNTITEVSKFTYEDGREYEVADVHYHNDDMDSWYNTDQSIYEINKEELKEILDSYRKEVFKKINIEIKKSSNKKKVGNLEGDWIQKIIEQETNTFIEKYKNLKNTESDHILEKVNLDYSINRREYEINCKKKIASFQKNKTEAIRDKIELINDAILKEINDKLKKENENINLKYNHKLRDAIKAESNRLLDYHRKNGKTQSDYNSAVEKYVQQAKEKFSQEAEEERVSSKAKYHEEYKERSKESAINTGSSFQEGMASDVFRKNYDCDKEEKRMKKLYEDQFFKGKKITDKDVELISIALKREANALYVYYVDKIEKSKDDTAEEKGDNVFNILSDWFKGTIKNKPQNEKKEDIIKFNKDEYYNKTGVELEEAIYKSEMLEFKIDPETLALPQMRGYGKIPSLYIAMSKNNNLKSIVKGIAGLEVTSFSKIYEKMIELMYEWGGVSKVQDGSRAVADGVNIEARKVAFIEQLTGQEFKQMGVAKFVGQHASTAVQKAWDIFLMRTTKNILVQGPLAKLFSEANYNFTQDEVQLNSSIDKILERAKELSAESSTSGFWYMLGYKGDYNFWVHLGYILSSCRSELNISLDALNQKLSDASGYNIKVGDDIFQIIGDSGDNELNGTSGSDYIKGLGGNDKIHGGEGSDHIEGDEGDDEIYGEDGIDRLHGGPGNDRIYGGNGRDFIYGDDGDDKIYGEEGDDHIEGGAGADEMDGGYGINTLAYGKSTSGVSVNLKLQECSGGDANGDKIANFTNIQGSEYNDNLVGDDNDNYINGEGGNDNIYGGKGDDDLFGGPGQDYLYGEEGDDRLAGFEGADHMDGGEGKDTVSYHHPYSTEGVIVDLKEGKGYSGYAKGDTYKNIENIIGSKHNDKLQGNDENNQLNGMEGDDIIHGGKGDDVIIAAVGNNNVFGEEGDDHILGGIGSNYIDGGDGEDFLVYVPLWDRVNTLAFRQTL